MSKMSIFILKIIRSSVYYLEFNKEYTLNIYMKLFFVCTFNVMYNKI